MMKKSIFSMMLGAVLMAAAGMTFTSCGDDNDEPDKKPDTPAVTEWSTSYNVEAKFEGDMLDICDITAHIANPDGTYREEKIENKVTKWTLTGDKIPDKAGVYFTFTGKTGLPADALYKVSVDCTIAGKSYKNNDEFASNSGSSKFHQTIKGSQVEDYFKKMRTVVVALGTNESGSVINVNSADVNFGVTIPTTNK